MKPPIRKSDFTRPPIANWLETLAWFIVLLVIAGMLALSTLSDW